MSKKILIVDDEKNMHWGLKQALKDKSYELMSAYTGAEAVEVVQKNSPALVLLDIRLPDMSGLDVLKEISHLDSDILVIMMTAHGTIDTAIQAMKLGAYDYLTKPFDIEELKLIIEKGLNYTTITKRYSLLDDTLKKSLNKEVIGESNSLKAILQIASQVAPTDATTLILGESGTGKEVIADYIYKLSARAKMPYIKINCGALAESILESELFGHEKGSFTGAASRKLGLFERADGGTIFLDEIGEISPSLQVKLLRILQQKTIMRVGGTEQIHVDVRIIAATNRSLLKMVQDGLFREDLYYRINVIPITIPSLRERKEDIPYLIEYFSNRNAIKMKKHPLQFSDEAMNLLSSYPWPGNIRELENVLERLCILSTSHIIDVANLPKEMMGIENNVDFLLPSEGIRLEEVEKSFIQQALAIENGNKTKAAELLGISRHTFLYRLDKLNNDV